MPTDPAPTAAEPSAPFDPDATRIVPPSTVADPTRPLSRDPRALLAPFAAPSGLVEQDVV